MTTGSIEPALPPSLEYTAPPITVTLTIIILVFFFLVFFSLYFCRCFMQSLIFTWRHNSNGSPEGGPTSPSAVRGLDPLIIQSFPSFVYSVVKDCRKEKYGLECAVCLDEFGENDVLRLIVSCNHVFHQECIDLWFESHKTCPVCRRNLDSPLHSPLKSPFCIPNLNHPIPNENEQCDGSFRIQIDEEKGHDHQRVDESCADQEEQQQKQQEADPPPLNKLDKFCRSHSTGHSIVTQKEKEEDRFTLRLPEHVKTKLIKGHNPSRSWTTFGEYKTKTNVGKSKLGEVSGEINKV